MDWMRCYSGGMLAGLVLASCCGCSTLGLSLYPSGATLTTESKGVLDASRIPIGMARENAKSVLPPHTIQPGDTLLIEPVSMQRDLRLPADQTVLADGTVDLGPYGRAIIAGHDIEQAESLIEQQITFQIRKEDQAQDAHNGPTARGSADAPVDNGHAADGHESFAINVRLLEPVHQFYVLGEVNAPGSYPLAGFETVLDAIVTAGGLTGSANPCQILLARPSDPCDCRVTLPVCYREIVQMGNTASNYQLRPGDRIFVATRSFMDELCFWRASKPCSQCSGCNKACRNPPLSTQNQIITSRDTMIPPGSTGWLHLSGAPYRPTGLVEIDRPTDAHPTPVFVDSGPSDVDGELEFAPLEQSAN